MINPCLSRLTHRALRGLADDGHEHVALVLGLEVLAAEVEAVDEGLHGGKPRRVWAPHLSLLLNN